MTQEAVVTRILPGGMAEVAVKRTTACGGNCSSCALNRIHAQPGQKVLIESQTSRVFKAAFLVYVFPLLLFLLGYLVSTALSLGETAGIICSFAGLVLGAVIVVLSQRRIREKDRITFEIIDFV